MLSTSAQAAMRKGPYLIYPGNNTQMQVLWQLGAAETCSLAWGPNTSYSDGDVDEIHADLGSFSIADATWKGTIDVFDDHWFDGARAWVG